MGSHREIAGMIHQFSRFSKNPLLPWAVGMLAKPVRRVGAHADAYLDLYDMFVAARKP